MVAKCTRQLGCRLRAVPCGNTKRPCLLCLCGGASVSHGGVARCSVRGAWCVVCDVVGGVCVTVCVYYRRAWLPPWACGGSGSERCKPMLVA